MIDIEIYRNLQAADRLTVTHSGRQRVALVLGWRDGRVEVRLHKTSGVGWVASPVLISRKDIIEVERCQRCGIGVDQKRHSDVHRAIYRSAVAS